MADRSHVDELARTASGGTPLGAPTVHGPPASFAGGLVELAAGTYAWLQPEGGFGESNAGLIVGDNEALVIDTLWGVPLTRRMLEAMRARVREPITTLVNTHADADHIWGNQLLGDAEIIATARAAAAFADERPALLRAAQAAGWLVRGGRRIRRQAPLRPLGIVPIAGSLLTGPDGFAERALAPFDFRGIRLRPPTRTFRGRLALEVGGRRVELVEVGPAHSPGDLIAWIEDARVCFAGDLLMIGGGLWPIMWSGPTENWLAGLDRVLALEPEAIVPGHGPLCDARAVTEARALVAWIDAEATSRLAAGQGVQEVVLALLGAVRGGRHEALRPVHGLHITVDTIDRHRRGRGERSPIERLWTLAAAERTARAAALA